jgi:hypothetical protein
MICNNRALPKPELAGEARAGRAGGWVGRLVGRAVGLAELTAGRAWPTAGRAWPTAGLAWLAAGLVLLGCGSVKTYDNGVPPGADFAGTWRLNAALSDDPRQALEKLRPPPRRSTYSQGVPSSGRRRRGQGQGSQQDPSLPDDLNGPEIRPSPIPLIPNIDVLRNEVLSIKQRPDAFVIDYGVTVRSYTPGLKSVVSVPGGVGDQSTGYHGKDYVIEISSQLGLQMTQVFSVSNKTGRQLIVKIHLSGTGIPTLNLNRVYDPTNAETPRSLPSID